jgi:hypothetical protein
MDTTNTQVILKTEREHHINGSAKRSGEKDSLSKQWLSA